MMQCGASADGGSPSSASSGTPGPAVRSSNRSTPGRSSQRTLITCARSGTEARMSAIISG